MTCAHITHFAVTLSMYTLSRQLTELCWRVQFRDIYSHRIHNTKKMTCASQAPQVPSHNHMHLRLGSAVCIQTGLCVLCQHGILCLHSDCRQHFCYKFVDGCCHSHTKAACMWSFSTLSAVLLCCWQLRMHPNEWRQELQGRTTVQLTYRSYWQSLTCQGMGLSVTSLLC